MRAAKVADLLDFLEHKPRPLRASSGPRVLEVSFGTGYLMTHYARRFTVYGIDYDANMVRTAHQNLMRHGLTAHLLQADVPHSRTETRASTPCSRR